MRIRTKIIISCLSILIAGILIVIIFSKDFSKTAEIEHSQVSKIVINTDWGKSKSITTKQDIQSIINILDSTRYSRNQLLPGYSGYLYNITFYSDSKKVANVTLGIYPIINGKKYISFDIDNKKKIQGIVGLYPPESRQEYN